MIMTEGSFVHYKVEIPHLDAEHWAMFKYLELLVEAKNKQQAINVIHKVAEEWLMHSQSEEFYMTEIGFPHLAAHQDEHQHVFRKLQELQTHILNDAYFGVRGYAEKLGEQLRNHIDHWDLQYSEWKNKLK